MKWELRPGGSTVGVSRNGKDLWGNPGSTENCSHIPFFFTSVLILLFKQFHSSTQIPHQISLDGGETEDRYYMGKGSRAIGYVEHFGQRRYQVQRQGDTKDWEKVPESV